MNPLKRCFQVVGGLGLRGVGVSSNREEAGGTGWEPQLLNIRFAAILLPSRNRLCRYKVYS